MRLSTSGERKDKMFSMLNFFLTPSTAKNFPIEAGVMIFLLYLYKVHVLYLFLYMHFEKPFSKAIPFI